MIRLLIVIFCLTLGACSQTCSTPRKTQPLHVKPRQVSPSSHSKRWASFPKTAKQARQLLLKYPPLTKKSTEPETEDVEAALIKQLKSGQLVAGWPQIIANLQHALSPQKPSFLLWGTSHDSRPQLTAFLRMIGGNGLQTVTDVFVEMFHADGHWADVPLSAQRGTNALLTQIAQNANPKALLSLYQEQSHSIYTGWKYHYIDDLVNLPLLAKARNIRVHGCDIPPQLRRQMSYRGKENLRIRELHCAQANRLSEARKRAVLMFWGQNHIGANGICRFLPKNALITSVYVYGERIHLGVMVSELQNRLSFTHPVLIKLASISNVKRRVLVLPGKYLSVPWMHTRARTKKKTSYNLEIIGDFASLRIAGRRFTKPTQVRLTAGWHAFSFKRTPKGKVVIGSVKVMKEGYTNVKVHRPLRIEYHYKKGVKW